MLGPMFALLLLTSPAAGPVDQSNCWLLCASPTPAPLGPSLIDRALGQDPDSLRQRVETLERQYQQQQNPLFRTDYTTPSRPSLLDSVLNPPLTQPSRPSLLFPSDNGTRCSGLFC